jgi:hypothetical protein
VGPTGPTGLLPNGSVAGVTPYWNGSSWVVNSTNIFNNGGNVGVNTSTPITQLTVVDDTLAGCRFCRRYSDVNNVLNVAWTCTNLEVANNLDMVGNVNSDDDIHFAVNCPAATAANFQLCARHADNNARHMVSFQCVDFRAGTDPAFQEACGSTVLCIPFTGVVDGSDDLDFVIRSKTPGRVNLTSCGIGVRWADSNGRANASWRFGSIGHVVKTDFSGDVDGTDDLDFMLSCAIPYEEY